MKIGALLLSVSNTLPSCLTFYFAVFVKKEAFSKQDLLNRLIVSQRRGAEISPVLMCGFSQDRITVSKNRDSHPLGIPRWLNGTESAQYHQEA